MKRTGEFMLEIHKRCTMCFKTWSIAQLGVEFSMRIISSINTIYTPLGNWIFPWIP